jgi:hypothetical protein
MNSNILTEYMEKAYTDAINRSWNSLMDKFRFTPHYTFRDLPELTTMACQVKISMFNRVINTRLTHQNVDEKVKETISYFKEKDLPFTWQVNPWDTPPNLPLILKENGLKQGLTPGMVLKLTELKPPKKPERFHAVEVETPEMREEYAWLLARGYGIPEFAHPIFVDMFNYIELTDDYCHYIGYLGGEPVSTTSILYSDGVAGIYNVATLPSARGKGMGSMITAVPLVKAIERGYKISILHSSPMGYNIYKRLGYEEICKMNRWDWKQEE